MDQVPRERVTNLGARRAERATHDRGEEMKSLPTALGMGLGQPDFTVPFGEEYVFALTGGSRH